MIVVHYTPTGMKRVTDLQGILHDRAVFLVGGAPSLLDQNYKLLESRGVMTMAVNNAAIHFQPDMWIGGDRPDCYEPQILEDPKIMKFGPGGHAEADIRGKKFYNHPSMYFYVQDPNVPWDEYLDNRPGVPWYTNTLFAAIHLLFNLGARTILLAGSDFGFSKNGPVYAHDSGLGDLEKKWNLDLYNSQVKELRTLRPLFERKGLRFIDTSLNSRLKQTYEHMSLDDGVALCRKDFPAEPADPKTLPHCSKFTNDDIRDRIAKWPGYRVFPGAEAPGKHVKNKQDMEEVL